MDTQQNSKYLFFDNPYGYATQDESINLKKLFVQYILKKWYVYLFFGTLFIGLAYYYIKSSQPIYEINAKLLIKEKETDYSSGDDWLNRSLKSSAASENVLNELEVLTSYSLMESVMEELGLDIRYYWKDKLEILEAYKDFPVQLDAYELFPGENTTFEIIPVSQDVFWFAQDGERIGKYTFGESFTNAHGTFCFERKAPLPIHGQYTMYVQIRSLKDLTADYMDNYQVRFSDVKKQSTILNLTLKDAVPERGEAILSRLVENYNKIKYEQNNELALNTLEFINDRLGSISTELRSVENSVQQYKLNNDIASQTTSDLDLMLTNVNQLGQEQKDLEVQINIIQSMKSSLEDQGENFELIPVNLSLINNQIQELISPYNELVLKRKQLLLIGESSNPLVQSVNQDLQSLKGTIRQALGNMEKDLQLKLSAAQSQYAAVSQRLKTVPVKERELEGKFRKQTITEDLYVYLLKKKEETALALVSNFSNSNMIDPPRSSLEPVAPSKMKIMIMAATAGFALPLFIIIGLSFFKDAIETEKDLNKLIPDVPVMGMISQFKGSERQVMLRQRRTITSEHFRTLRTNIQFHFRTEPKCIMVTSSNSGEGKTFVATNLAISYALAKKKTLIIDFDLHRPDLDQYLEEKAELGLSNYLLNPNLLKKVIHPSSHVPNLDFITSGPVQPNPSELITEGNKLAELFDYLKNQYDVIIVDTPPIGIVSDAVLLNDYITTSIFVTRSGYTKNEMAEKAKELFKKKVVANPILVLNGIKDKSLYGYHYKKYAS